MVEGHQEEFWLNLSHLLSKIHNSTVTKRQHLTTAMDFNPVAQKVKHEEMVAWADAVDDDLAVGVVTF